MSRFPIAVAIALALPAAPAASQAANEPVTPLFASEVPLRVTIRGPVNDIVRNAERNPNGRPATITVGAETQTITLSPRGITRRRKETCQFPPLRIEFPRVVPAPSQFERQLRLKLVTHCRPAEAFQQHVALEYAAYRLYNVMTPRSFKVRMLQVDYVEDDGRPVASRLGFVIEDPYLASRRNGMKEAKVGQRIPVARLSQEDAARFAVFAYMIGNLDWAMQAGPPGDRCCHNSRLIAADGSQTLVPIPYDFDFSGLVDAPYATPPEQVRVSSVRTRHYRGFCRDNPQALVAAAEFRARRGELMAALASVPGLADGPKRKASAYLDRFFADIATDASVQDKLLKTCVR